MNIVTLTSNGLDWQTQELAKTIGRDHPEPFGAVIAIKRGGSYIAQSFFKNFAPERFSAYAEVELQRPSTKRKKGWLVKILPHLPLWMLDGLRCAEASLLEFKHRISKREVPRIELDDEVADRLKNIEGDILIIDDAIDSGLTAGAVVNAIRNLKGNARIYLMVITVTTSRPLVTADYYIYNNKTLVRFPWSNDCIKA